jgi:predicted DNA-binding mobile mystery protein A
VQIHLEQRNKQTKLSNYCKVIALQFMSYCQSITLLLFANVNLYLYFCLNLVNLYLYFMGKKSLQFQQLDRKIADYATLKQVAVPPTGWIKAIRTTLGMSLQQLGNKLSVSKQGVSDMENREKDGSITIKALKEIAKALDMQLVYGFVPNDGSLETLVEKRAMELATEIVLRTSNTMKLEDQGNSHARIEKAIKERAEEIKNEMPKMLWD